MNRWAISLLLLPSTGALGAGYTRANPIPRDVSTERYAEDLVGSDAVKRQYAARVLRRRVRTAWRNAARAGGNLQTIEARQTLSDFDLVVAPRCIRQISVDNVRRACAQILGMLETEQALPALQAALTSTISEPDRKAIQAAIRRIEDTQ